MGDHVNSATRAWGILRVSLQPAPELAGTVESPLVGAS
jgi:hypothetical protein